MSNFKRNPYDKSIFEELITEDLINKCITESYDKNYKINSNWQKFLERECYNNPIDVAKNNSNMKKFDRKISLSFLPAIIKLVGTHHVSESGHFLYPPTGYMGWHTNYKVPCKRLYITYATEDKKSFFRYIDPLSKEVITDYDDKGITIREFDVTGKPPYLWHCVGSECMRLSFGYQIRLNNLKMKFQVG
tara:strand:+ start:3044 stop:3613 length:570 start_codon:yes stop_codon:yes gene_type:complete